MAPRGRGSSGSRKSKGGCPSFEAPEFQQHVGRNRQGGQFWGVSSNIEEQVGEFEQQASEFEEQAGAAIFLNGRVGFQGLNFRAPSSAVCFQGSGAESQCLQSGSQGFGVGSQALRTESQCLQSGSQGFGVGSQALRAESQCLQSGSQGFGVGSQALRGGPQHFGRLHGLGLGSEASVVRSQDLRAGSQGLESQHLRGAHSLEQGSQPPRVDLQEWTTSNIRSESEQILGSRGTVGGEKSQNKGKNFNHEEEKQLTRSFLAISQDPIIGNQQRAGTFWQRIFEHYNKRRPGDVRSARSLESKWGLIKHDVTRFVSVYQQIAALNPIGTSKEDILRMAKELYRSKSAKNSDFVYDHCWLLVRDFPKWAAGSSTMTSSTANPRKSQQSNQEPQGCSSKSTPDSRENVQGVCREGNEVFQERPVGSKAAKEVQKESKIKEGLGYAQVKATTELTAATMKKNQILEEQNLLLLMTTPTSQIVAPAAQEFLRLRQEEELMKLQLRLESDLLAKAKLKAQTLATEKAIFEAQRMREVEEEQQRDETRRQIEERQYNLNSFGTPPRFTMDRSFSKGSPSRPLQHNHIGGGETESEDVQFASHVEVSPIAFGGDGGYHDRVRFNERSPPSPEMHRHKQRRIRETSEIGSADGIQGGQASEYFNSTLDGGGRWSLNSNVQFNEVHSHGVHVGGRVQAPFHCQQSTIHLQDDSDTELDSMDHVDANMPSTWRVLGVQSGESQNVQASTNLGIDLSLNGRPFCP